jgi:hypothetical protein
MFHTWLAIASTRVSGTGRSVDIVACLWGCERWGIRMMMSPDDVGTQMVVGLEGCEISIEILLKQ